MPNFPIAQFPQFAQFPKLFNLLHFRRSKCQSIRKCVRKSRLWPRWASCRSWRRGRWLRSWRSGNSWNAGFGKPRARPTGCWWIPMTGKREKGRVSKIFRIVYYSLLVFRIIYVIFVILRVLRILWILGIFSWVLVDFEKIRFLLGVENLHLLFRRLILDRLFDRVAKGVLWSIWWCKLELEDVKLWLSSTYFNPRRFRKRRSILSIQANLNQLITSKTIKFLRIIL